MSDVFCCFWGSFHYFTTLLYSLKSSYLGVGRLCMYHNVPLGTFSIPTFKIDILLSLKARKLAQIKSNQKNKIQYPHFVMPRTSSLFWGL
jgi:hypothetical protein